MKIDTRALVPKIEEFILDAARGLDPGPDRLRPAPRRRPRLILVPPGGSVFFFSAFFIASDASRSDVSEIKSVTGGNIQIETSANVADPAKLGLVHAALVQLAAQNDDGEDETTRTVYAGFASGSHMPIKYVRADDSFQVGNAAPWSRAKTAGFLAGLVANGLVSI